MDDTQDTRLRNHATARRKARRISAETWEQHREIIVALFIEAGKTIEGHDGVKEVMRIEHNFIAT